MWEEISFNYLQLQETSAVYAQMVMLASSECRSLDVYKYHRPC
jgi:hypothetical protein